MLELTQVSTSIASPYKSLYVWVKHFFGYLVYDIFLWPESKQGALYTYVLSFSRLWTLSIERFWILLWSILNGMTLKTSNRSICHPTLGRLSLYISANISTESRPIVSTDTQPRGAQITQHPVLILLLLFIFQKLQN